MNLLDLFAIPRRRSPGKLALRFAPEGELPFKASHERLWAAAERLAAGFQVRGLGRGDRLALYLGNGPEFVTAFLAALRLGAVVVPANPAYRRRELGHILADAAPSFLVTGREQLPVVEEVPAEERGSAEVVLAEDFEPWGGDPTTLRWPVLDGDDLALLLYTSGTTGRSKGAMLSHGNLVATVAGLLAAWAWEPQDVLYLALPLFHTHGLVVGLCTALAAGATVHLESRFDAARAVAELERGATVFFGVPTLYVRLVHELRSRERRPDLSRVRLFCSGSAPLSPETFAAFRELAGHEVLERYGMTEAGMILSNLYPGPRRPGSVGVPLPGVSVRLTEEKEGELLVRGGNVFAGYWRDPEKTAAAFRTDGAGRRWLATGDMARRDPETGAYSLLGRKGDLILCGGFNIYPREVEEALLAFPGIREAAVAGRPDPDLGEVPVAFLVADGPLDEAGLRAFLEGQLARYKVPRRFHALPELPRNAMGKVEKHRLGEAPGARPAPW